MVITYNRSPQFLLGDVIIVVSSSSYQVLQLEQVQDQATELSVNIMRVRILLGY